MGSPERRCGPCALEEIGQVNRRPKAAGRSPAPNLTRTSALGEFARYATRAALRLRAALAQAAGRTTLAPVMSASVGVPAWRMIATSSRLRMSSTASTPL